MCVWCSEEEGSSQLDENLGGRGQGGSAYERGGDARRKFGIKPLKETEEKEKEAWPKPFLTPKRDHVKNTDK